MAGQDNRLGAPTEGLGQTVTFAIGDSARTPQASAGQQGQLRVNASGSGQARNTASGITLNPVGESEILKTLNRLGQDILKPKIEAARNAAFVSGMQRVASGEAIQEIVNEQPWYSQIFGDTPAVEGARAFTGFAKAQAITAEIDADMGNLREMSPQSFKQVMTDRLTSIGTGDPDTDVMVANSLIKEMPTIMKRHTKEHIGWQQDNMAKAQQGAQAAAANSLMATLSKFNSSASVDDIANGASIGSTLDEGDVLEKKIAFANTFSPIPGVPLETTQKLSTATIGGLLSQRNLHAYYTLEDAGVVESLGPENAKRLRDQADRVESRARAEMPESLSNDFADVRAMVAMYDSKGIKEALGKRVSKLNSDYKALTGAREPLISGASRADMLGDLMTKQINAKRTAQEAWDRRERASAVSYGGTASKAQETETAIVTTQTMMREGRSIRTLPKALRDATWASLHPQPNDDRAVAAQRRGLLTSARISQFHNGTVDEEGRGYMQTRAMMAESSDNSSNWDELYRTEYLPLIGRDGSESIAAGYFGEEFGRKMNAYHRLGVPRDDINSQVAAFTQVTKVMGATGNWTKGTEDSNILIEVKKQLSNDNPTSGWFSSNKVSDAAAQSVVLAIKRGVSNRGGISLADSVASHISGLRTNGDEFVGGYRLSTMKSGERISVALDKYGIAAKNDVPPDRVDDVVGQGIDREAARVGIKEAIPVYAVDARGNPIITLIGFNKAGKLISTNISIPDLHDNWAKGNVKTKLQYGPKLTYLPKEGQPGLSASQEEWAAYRKRQAAMAK